MTSLNLCDVCIAAKIVHVLYNYNYTKCDDVCDGCIAAKIVYCITGRHRVIIMYRVRTKIKNSLVATAEVSPFASCACNSSITASFSAITAVISACS